MTTIADGTLEIREDGKTVIRFERRLSHPVDRVWEALTDHDQVIRWWGDLDAEFEPQGRFVLRWLNENASAWRGTVTELEPGRVLETSGNWGSTADGWADGVPGSIRFELMPEGDVTVLRFTNIVELPEDFKTKTLAGWHFHLDALVDLLDGQPPRDLENIEGWEQIHEAYLS